MNDKLNWDNIDDIMRSEEAKKSSFTPSLLPNDTYDAIISGSEIKLSKKGDTYLNIAFTILSPDAHRNRIIFDIYMQTHDNSEVVDRAKYKLRQVCMAAMGKLADYPIDLIGKKAKLIIKIVDDKENGVIKTDAEGNPVQKNVIMKVLSVNEYVPSVPQVKLNYDSVPTKKPLIDMSDMDDDLPM